MQQLDFAKTRMTITPQAQFISSTNEVVETWTEEFLVALPVDRCSPCVGPTTGYSGFIRTRRWMKNKVHHRSSSNRPSSQKIIKIQFERTTKRSGICRKSPSKASNCNRHCKYQTHIPWSDTRTRTELWDFWITWNQYDKTEITWHRGWHFGVIQAGIAVVGTVTTWGQALRCFSIPSSLPNTAPS